MRLFLALLAFAFTSVTIAQDKVSLATDAKVGDSWVVSIDMKLTGNLKKKEFEREESIPLTAIANHAFEERVFQIDKNGTPSAMARFYSDAKAEITLQGTKMARVMRKDRKFLIAMEQDLHTVCYSPQGPMTRTEVDLSEHFDVLALYGVLPTKSVAVNDPWDIAIPTAQRMLGLDAVIDSKLKATLVKVEQNHALVAVEGGVTGISKGSQTRHEIKGSLTYALQSKRFTGVNWKVSESKEQGPMGPGTALEIDIVAKWNNQPHQQLTEGLLSMAKANPDAGQLLVEHNDGNNRYSFLLDRSWGVVMETKDETVLRLLDKGELIGQLNVSTVKNTATGKHPTLDEMEKLITTAPGFELEKVLDKAEPATQPGYWMGKVAAVGKASQIPLQMSLYCVQGPGPEPFLFNFTMEIEHANRFNTRDQAIMKSINLSPIVTTGGSK